MSEIINAIMLEAQLPVGNQAYVKMKITIKIFFCFSFGLGKVVESFFKKKFWQDTGNRLCKRLSQWQAPFKQKRAQFLGNNTLLLQELDP